MRSATPASQGSIPQPPPLPPTPQQPLFQRSIYYSLTQEYADSIKSLRKQCLEAGMTDADFRKMYFGSLDSLNANDFPELQNNRRIKTKYRLIFIGMVSLLCAAYHYKTLYSCLVCNLQDYVYPGLKLLRRISIPFISLFPSLAEFYHESCLIQNPFFSVVDMDCWPCSAVSNVREIYRPKPGHQQHSVPFIYETEQKPILLENIKTLFIRNEEVFKRESSKILVNNRYYIPTEEMFMELNKESNKFYIWKFNNMNLARILRQIIQRPEVVPKFGQSTERFLIIDSSQSSFQVPDTECNFSFLLALSGTRTIYLTPAEECKFQCKTLKVDLKETYLLWYNWWYWRPVIQTSTGNSSFIAHVGSYC